MIFFLFISNSRTPKAVYVSLFLLVVSGDGVSLHFAAIAKNRGMSGIKKVAVLFNCDWVAYDAARSLE